VQPQLPGDKPHAVPLTVQCHNVHKRLLGCPKRVPCQLPRGGTLFIPIFGTLLHTYRHGARQPVPKSVPSSCGILRVRSGGGGVFSFDNPFNG
jgi:hypothetical protein